MNQSNVIERKKSLEKTLQNDFDFKVISDIENIDYPLLLILDYSPKNEDKPVSFAFSLLQYYKNVNDNFESRFWMTEENTYDNSRNNSKWPNYEKSYEKFKYLDYCFYPFSAKIEGYNFLDIQTMKALLHRLYDCIKFEVKK